MDTSDTDDAAPERDLADPLGFERAHADTSDTRRWVSDREDVTRIAWGLMTPERKAAFRDHPDILALEESVGGGTSAA